MSLSMEVEPVWPTERGSGRGRRHGTSSREPFDRWFRYPAGFASDYVALLLDGLELRGGTVVDCFAGSGVTGTAARTRGLAFAGVEAHPLIAELARLKLAPTADPSEVRALSLEVASHGRRAARETPASLSGEVELVRRSFGDTTLGALVAMRDLIKKEQDRPGAGYVKWALLATLRDVADVKVGWPYQRPGSPRKPRFSDPISRFEDRVEMMAYDLEELAAESAIRPYAQVITGDSREPSAWAALEGPFAACVSSPPYLNNFDYADATRLELYFWGDVSTWHEMCRDVRGDMLTATTQQSSVAERNSSIRQLEERGSSLAGVDGPVDEVLAIVGALTDAKRLRGRRSKEYDQVAPAYFLAMWDVLRNLHDNLEDGANAVWLVGDSAPYGVYVDTPRLMGEFAEQVGFRFADDVSLRVRGERWAQNADRHRVPLSERLIVLKKDGPAARPGDVRAAPLPPERQSGR
ncbi:DNA methyltransferase [Cellulomonas sp. KRMCY2]|uniref:DNA methyltransferase n=1 Tax=Cellulomonas sp. KRMCY2 TaxID=1304865 RepID=UPI0018CC242C|nr:DNA methyltransferase [Cellulomonas sp. KRMCY2]